MFVMCRTFRTYMIDQGHHQLITKSKNLYSKLECKTKNYIKTMAKNFQAIIKKSIGFDKET